MKVKRAILLCTFGSSDIKGIEESIGKLKKELETYFHLEVEIAFTSKVILNKLDNMGYHIRNLAESLNYLHKNDFTEVIIQPLYIMDGTENIKLKAEVDLYKGYFDKLIINKNLFGTEKVYNKEAFKIVAKIIEGYLREFPNVLIAGHGSKTSNNSIYLELKRLINKRNEGQIYMATLEGKESLAKAIEEMKNDKVKSIMIMPFFLMKGQHIMRDIYGEKDSWKTILQGEGLKVECSSKSLLQYKEIRSLYLEMLDFSDNLQNE